LDTTSSPQNAEDISIIIHFAEEKMEEWPDIIIQNLNEILILDENNFNHIYIKVKGFFNQETGRINTVRSIVNNIDEEKDDFRSYHLNHLISFNPLFYLSALRNVSQEFGEHGKFWKDFLKSINLSDNQSKKIEENLENINTSLINSDPGLLDVIQKISDVNKFVSLYKKEPVSFEAIPTRIFDLIGKIQVFLKSSEGVKIPLARHGEGTQSLAVLMLFQAFVSANLAKLYKPESKPILALEEPEAHLHPAAIRSLAPFLGTVSGQVLIATHSGDLVSQVPIQAIRRLYKKNGEILIGKIDSNFLEETNKYRSFEYHVRATKGSYFFAKCWLLVEGESDFWYFLHIAAVLGKSLDENNISIIDFCQGGGPAPYIKAAKALGIDWVILVDGDEQGNHYKKIAEKFLFDDENSKNIIFQLQNQDIEHEFYFLGYKGFYKNYCKNNI
jgi:putative ATP-dependent endonuclease of OLD family